jgi:hypothetical protein
MGATVRLAQDKRIMIRNTAEVWWPMSMSAEDLKQRKAIHMDGLENDCRSLPPVQLNILGRE